MIFNYYATGINLTYGKYLKEKKLHCIKRELGIHLAFYGCEFIFILFSGDRATKTRGCSVTLQFTVNCIFSYFYICS